jgi:hypothetical protein
VQPSWIRKPSSVLLSFAILLVLLSVILPPSASAYIDEAYGTNGTYTPPANYGSFGPNSAGFPDLGQTYLDTTFDTTIRRLSKTGAPGAWQSSHDDVYAKNGFWNSNGTLVLHRSAAGGWQFVDPNTGQVVGFPAPNSSPSPTEGSFSSDPTKPHTWYFFDGSSLKAFDVLTGVTTIVKTFGGALGALGGSVDWIDRSGRYMVLRIGSVIKVYDLQLDQLYSGDIPGTYGQGGGWVGISPDGEYVVTAQGPPTPWTSFKVDHATKSVATTAVLFWTLCTSDHGDLVSASNGKTYIVTFECHSFPAIYAVDVSLPQSASNLPQQRAQNFKLFDLSSWEETAAHFSGVSKVGRWQDWAYISFNSGDDEPAGAPASNWRPYKSEVLMVNVLTGEKRRLTHHRSQDTTLDYRRTTRVSASWDGERAAWASSFNIGSPADYADKYAVDLTGTQGPPPPGDPPPTVSITNPADGSTVSGTINVSATASDNIGVAGVQFKLNGANLGAEDTVPPYEIAWDTTTVPEGVYTLTAVARDTANQTTTSAGVTVTVDNPPPSDPPPTVSITSPANGATVSGTITVTATASDNVSVAGVQFKVNGVNIGAEDTTAPYSVSWDTTTATPGSNTLTAVARDSAGQLTPSEPVIVTVTTGGPVEENVVWTNTVNVTVNGNSITKNAGCNGCWDSGAASQQTIASGDGYVKFTTSNGATLNAGLSNGNAGTNANDIKYALRFFATYVEVRELGVWKASWNVAAGDVHKVAVEGGVVKYYHNGTLKYTSATAPTYPLLVDATMTTVGETLQNAVIARVGGGGGGGGSQNVVWIDAVNATVNGNSITKNAGCNGCWDSGAASQQTIASGNGSVEFSTSAGASLSTGLSNSNPGLNANDIKWGLRFFPGSPSYVEVRELGVWKASWNVAASDVHKIAVDGGAVKYYQNGALKYTSAVAPTYPLLLDATLATVGETLQNAVITGAQ